MKTKIIAALAVCLIFGAAAAPSALAHGWHGRGHGGYNAGWNRQPTQDMRDMRGYNHRGGNCWNGDGGYRQQRWHNYEGYWQDQGREYAPQSYQQNGPAPR